MKAHVVPNYKADFQDSKREAIQRKATTTVPDNRLTAVKQRVIQQAVMARQGGGMPKMIQRVAGSRNRSIGHIGSNSLVQRKVVDGSTSYSGGEIYKRHQATFDEAGVTKSELVEFVDACQDMTLTDLLKKFGINSVRKKEKVDKKDTTFRGKRIVGDSSALARNRFNLSVKKYLFKPWKKNREAQHIIPASIAKAYPILNSIIDEAENGIMLPAVYQTGNKKLTHRKPKHRDHAKYTRNVRELIKKILKSTNLKNNQATMRMVMRSLRPVNKLVKYRYIDDIPRSEYVRSWNNSNAAYQIK